MKMKKIVFALLVAIILVAGCAKTWDIADGGLFTSHKAPYIVINQSGGMIMDVYKLENATVQRPRGSGGWLFKDNDGHPVYLGGDVKIIRLESTSDPLWENCFEYHIESEVNTYQQKYMPFL